MLIISKLYNHLKLLNTIDVFWWSKVESENSKFENFGDYLVPFLLQKLANKKIRRVNPNSNKVFRLFKKKHYFIIGSILNSATTHTIVWGAGIVIKNEKVKSAKFLSVRGPLTRDRLIELGYKVPVRYGDPAILLALFTNNDTVKKYKLGIIPHYVDFELANDTYQNESDVNVIDLCTNNPQDVIDSILECKYIISSSLHGIIAAHALNIPVLWTKISNNLYGDDVKFDDYYQSLEMYNVKAVEFKHYRHEDILRLFDRYKEDVLPKKENFDKLVISLIDTFPFKKSKKFKRLIKKYLLGLKS
ncbi:polysaccharide pyruvyl transferase family protein [Polaribacter atrinae]|uniref:polysaccharide pyruvyl transferase family protein n=1 Tax=Polaribacter atrinae TaxID=1333662 RepID=UPI00248F7E5B|nr:polysaccharide pyruvyl transferase family protein [Polaribacter atrinae]